MISFMKALGWPLAKVEKETYGYKPNQTKPNNENLLTKTTIDFATNFLCKEL